MSATCLTNAIISARGSLGRRHPLISGSPPRFRRSAMARSIMTRRGWIAAARFGAATLGWCTRLSGAEAPPAGQRLTARALAERRKYLESVMPSAKDVESFIATSLGPDEFSVNNGFTFDAE